MLNIRRRDEIWTCVRMIERKYLHLSRYLESENFIFPPGYRWIRIEEDCLILVADRVDGDVVPVHNVEGVRVPGVVPGHVPPALAPVWVGEPVADPRERPVNPHLGPASLLCLL